MKIDASFPPSPALRPTRHRSRSGWISVRAGQRVAPAGPARSGSPPGPDRPRGAMAADRIGRDRLMRTGRSARRGRDLRYPGIRGRPREIRRPETAMRLDFAGRTRASASVHRPIRAIGRLRRGAGRGRIRRPESDRPATDGPTGSDRGRAGRPYRAGPLVGRRCRPPPGRGYPGRSPNPSRRPHGDPGAGCCHTSIDIEKNFISLA